MPEEVTSNEELTKTLESINAIEVNNVELINKLNNKIAELQEANNTIKTCKK